MFLYQNCLYIEFLRVTDYRHHILSTQLFLERQNLLSKEGGLPMLPFLLFGKRPHTISPTTNFKIGRFGYQRDHKVSDRYRGAFFMP